MVLWWGVVAEIKVLYTYLRLDTSVEYFKVLVSTFEMSPAHAVHLALREKVRERDPASLFGRYVAQVIARAQVAGN